MYYSGFISHTGGRDSINDLEKSRKAYFSVSSTKYFDLNFAGSFDRDSIHQRASNELDTYIEDLAGKLGSDTKNLKKLRTYIYINRTDLQEFLGVPSVMQMFGLNVNDVIHGYTFDLDILKHEAAHNFILQKIGNNTNVFFIEGFRQFTEYLFDEEKFGDDIEITSVHLDLLTHDLLMGDVRIFFNNPQSYAISGVFVIFMIDKMGLENFKELYSGNNLDTDLKQKYGCNLEQLMDEFKATFNL